MNQSGFVGFRKYWRIHKTSPKYASLTISNLLTTAQLLEKQPQMGRIVPEIGQNEIREIIKGNYRIIYRFQEDIVEILTIHHSSKLFDIKEGDY